MLAIKRIQKNPNFLKLTPRQQKVVINMIDNVRTLKYKTLGQLLRSAKYSQAISEHPFKVLNSPNIRRVLSDNQILNEFKQKRDLASSKITPKKLDKCKPKELAQIVDIFQRNTLLLQGKATEISKTTNLNVDLDLNKLNDDQINDLLKNKLNNN